MTALSNKVGAQLIELLGLPKNTVSFDVKFAVDKPVTIRCPYYPDELSARHLTELLGKEFTLEPKPQEEVATLASTSKEFRA